MSLSIKKKDLWHYVNRKINRMVHRHHVYAVIVILFEEMLKDLKEGKSIKIANFGTVALKTTKPRWYHHIKLRKVMMSEVPRRVMQFRLATKIHKKLVELFDLDRFVNHE
jgi:nucleoid DNA-binding protein